MLGPICVPILDVNIPFTMDFFFRNFDFYKIRKKKALCSLFYKEREAVPSVRLVKGSGKFPQHEWQEIFCDILKNKLA